MFKVYIAGPITAKTVDEERGNVERALDIADKLVAHDMAVYLPHISWFTDQQAKKKGLRPLGYFYLNQDIEWLVLCDAVFRMKGDSLGADKEVKIAREKGIPVYTMIDSIITDGKSKKKAAYDKRQEDVAAAKVDPSNFDERVPDENPFSSNECLITIPVDLLSVQYKKVDHAKRMVEESVCVAAVEAHSQSTAKLPGFKVSEVIEYPSGARESKLNHRFDLVPLEGLKAVAEVAAYGATKYGVDNWKKGIPANSMLNHALRHVILFLSGDTTEDHLPHAAWRLLAAIDCLKMDPKPTKQEIPNGS